VAGRHHHGHLLGDQNDDCARGPRAGGSWRAGCLFPSGPYWPEFAANGKANVEVRHLLSHTSGASGWEPPFAHEDVYDWERSTSRLAAQAPWWELGSASGYHDTSYGHLVGEVVRRVTGISIGRFFADEIARTLGADFHIGLADRDFPRVSKVIFPGYPFEDPDPPEPDSVPAKTSGPLFDMPATATAAWRRAEIPAAPSCPGPIHT